MRICPRCGKVKMHENKVRNSLSRYRDEYICSDCGMDEALRDFYDLPQEEIWFVDILRKALQ